MEAGIEAAPPVAVKEHDTTDLLTLATNAIAKVVGESPQLFPAAQLQRLLPDDRKTTIALTFVRNAKVPLDTHTHTVSLCHSVC